jgi:succinoglycan biosynthesis transport protein ExoP
MPETLEENKAETLDMQLYLDVARRRCPQFLIALFFGWLLVWGASWVLPVRYKSSTTILVEQPTMSKEFVTSNINEDLQDRLQNIAQQILSRTRLLHIIGQFNLYNDAHNPLNPDEKAARMRKDIALDLVRDPRDNRITAFKIDYSASDPHVAQKVTQELTELFINENLEVRQQQSEDTTKFLGTQLEAARQSLAQQDAKIRIFKGEHIGDLPTQQASNLQILAGMQSQLGNEQDALNTAHQQQVYLQTLINQYRTLQGTPKSADGVGGLPSIDKELERLRSELADLSSKYTDQYPDVGKVKDQIAKTEKMRDALIADLKNHANAETQADSSTAPRDLTVDPTQNAAILQLQSQLQANRIEISNREQGIAALKAKVNDYQGRLNDEPVREQQLADLTRGYDQSRSSYDDLLKKENESKMATSMEQMEKGERFRMIDPPSFPMKPDFPDRLKFCGAGIGLGLALGLAVVGGLEFIDDRMNSEKAIRALLPMKVISEIPEVLMASDIRQSRTRTILRWAMAGFVFAAILAGSAYSFLRG